jgi:hypothetical protein
VRGGEYAEEEELQPRGGGAIACPHRALTLSQGAHGAATRCKYTWSLYNHVVAIL